MMKRMFLLFAFIGVMAQGLAQVLNVESLRRVSDTTRWSGFTNLTMNLTQNKNRIIDAQNKIHVQHLFGKSMLLLVNRMNLKESNEVRLVSKGTQHLRYNYRVTERVALEAFGQSQYDEISAIDFRGLMGAGPRFKLFKSEDYNFYLGVLTMYEYEEILSDVQHSVTRDLRKSSYISFGLFPKAGLSIVSTTYYQPMYRDFGEYRISNDSSLALSATKKLAIKIGFTYLYDASPAIGVPREQFKLSNGLTYMLN